MKLNGQIHTTTALPPEKKPGTNFQELLQIPFSHASTLSRKECINVKKMRCLKIDILFPVAKRVTWYLLSKVVGFQSDV